MIRFAMMDDSSYEPTRKHDDDAGIDLYNNEQYPGINKTTIIKPGEVGVIHTRTRFEVPKGCLGWVTNKGGPDYLVGAGIVDENYQGEVVVKIFNVSNDIIYIKRGQAVAQIIFQSCVVDELLRVDNNYLFVEETSRGSTGGIHG